MRMPKLGCFNVPCVFPMWYSYWSASLANHMNYYRFCILVHICCYHWCCFMVLYHKVGCI